MVKEPIKVWEFYDAPDEFRILSRHGGDEDWLAECPPHYSGKDKPYWIESGAFAICDCSEHDHPTKKNWKIYIGAHA